MFSSWTCGEKKIEIGGGGGGGRRKQRVIAVQRSHTYIHEAVGVRRGIFRVVDELAAMERLQRRPHAKRVQTRVAIEVGLVV